MGYTHYWRQSQTITPELVDAVNKVIAESGIPLRKEYDLPGTQPEVSIDRIRFNGVDEDGHETFYFRAGSGFDFCKTQHKPYDVVVTAVLTLVSHFGLATISSDGDASEWRRGVDLAIRATGLDLQNPRAEDEDDEEE